jgi:N-dimethylarginine dimethylaminohydrolase
MSIGSFLKYGAIDKAALYQSLHNRWTLYRYEKVRQQQENFIQVMRDHGVEVFLADNISDCASQHYIRDIGFAIDDVFFCANPRRYYRQRELQGLNRLLSRISRVIHLETGNIEGGDVLVDDEYIIVGLGEETNRAGAICLQNQLKEMGIERQVVILEFSHRGIIHLDTKFNIIAQRLGLIAPKSFTPQSLQWLEKHFDLIEVTDLEMTNLEVNTLTLSPNQVIMLKQSHRLSEILKSRGIEVIQVDYSEVTKLPGSFRCTTLPIYRA